MPLLADKQEALPVLLVGRVVWLEAFPLSEAGLAVKNSQARGTRDQDSTECGPFLLCLTSQVTEVSGVRNHLAKLSRE